jgi:hypothetical protein
MGIKNKFLYFLSDSEPREEIDNVELAKQGDRLRFQNVIV